MLPFHPEVMMLIFQVGQAVDHIAKGKNISLREAEKKRDLNASSHLGLAAAGTASRDAVRVVLALMLLFGSTSLAGTGGEIKAEVRHSFRNWITQPMPMNALKTFT